MKYAAYIASAIGLVALGTVAGRLAWGSHPTPVAEGRSDENRSAVSRQISELENKVETLRQMQVRPEPARLSDEQAPGRGTKTASDAKPRSVTDEERKARAIEQEHRLVERLDRRVEEETIDVPWATSAAREMSESVRTALAGTKLEEVRCQSSLCRVAVTHADAKAEEDFVATLPHLKPFASRGFIHKVGTEESPRSVVYVARAGFDLPVD